MRKFKDACDKCGKFDYCAGFEGKIYCPQCLPATEEKPEVTVQDERQYNTTSGLIELFTRPVCSKE